MRVFVYRGDELFCEDVGLSSVAEAVGTPFYVYSRRGMESNYDRVGDALSGADHLVCYALKANANPHLIRILADRGCGADVVSGGELKIALLCGIPADRIVFAGVGKTDAEIAAAVDAEILSLHVESMEELRTIGEVCRKTGKVARISIRVNPDVDPKTHPYIATGLKETKFGIAMERALEAYTRADSIPDVEVHGIHCHLGSMIMEAEPYVEAARACVDLIRKLASRGITVSDVDIGGGLGVDCRRVVEDGEEESPPVLGPEELFSRVLPILKEVRARLVFEPGRYLVADAGALVTRITYTKRGNDRNFAVVDAGMNDFIRPSLYDAYHQIVPVRRNSGNRQGVHVVGPICESGDFFSRERGLPPVRRGDLLAVMATGAYGYSLSSNYNARMRVPEVLVEGENIRVVRRRETFEDLLRGTDVECS